MDAVGGDLYDFIRIDADRFAVLVADVTGHGIPAALLSTMLKTAAAAQSHVAGEPGRVVEEINRRLHGQLDGYLVTLVYAVVDTRARQLALSNAGHPAPLLRRRGEPAAELGSADAAIGVIEDESYATTRVGLESGDRLVFYTDGLTEAESPDGERFSIDRVKQLLAGDGESDVEQWTGRLLEGVKRWRGQAELQDDLTVVSLDIPCRPVVISPAFQNPGSRPRPPAPNGWLAGQQSPLQDPKGRPRAALRGEPPGRRTGQVSRPVRVPCGRFRETRS